MAAEVRAQCHNEGEKLNDQRTKDVSNDPKVIEHHELSENVKSVGKDVEHNEPAKHSNNLDKIAEHGEPTQEAEAKHESTEHGKYATYKIPISHVPREVLEWIRNNPRTAGFYAANGMVIICPALLTGPVLGLLGFGPLGPVAGELQPLL